MSDKCKHGVPLDNPCFDCDDHPIPMSESQTPRTDEVMARLPLIKYPCTAVEALENLGSFARELESELTATRARLVEEETAHLKTIDERDAAEEAMSRAYFLVFGSSPEWSNQFGYEAANEDIEDAVNALKQSTSRLAELEGIAERLASDLRAVQEEQHGDVFAASIRDFTAYKKVTRRGAG